MSNEKQTNSQQKPKQTARQYSHGKLTILAILLFVGIIAVVIFSSRAEKALNERRQEEIAQATPIPTPDDDSEITDWESFEDGMNQQKELEETIANNSFNYSNLSVLTCHPGEGMTFQAGIANPDLTDALYLNFHFEDSNSSDQYPKYGFVVQVNGGQIEYGESTPADILDDLNTYEKDLYVAGRTYDKCVPAGFFNTRDYGIRWIGNDGLVTDNTTLRMTMNIRIVRLATQIADPTSKEHHADGYLLGAVKLDITYDPITKTCKLENLRLADVYEEGDLVEDKRAELIDQAIAYLQAGNAKYHYNFSDIIDHTSEESNIVVEKLGRTYYPRLFNSNGSVIASGQFSDYDVYAVNIPDEFFGFFTVYLIPNSQLRGTAKNIDDPNEETFSVVGYDPPLPQSLERLKMDMLEKDYEAFYFDDQYMYG